MGGQIKGKTRDSAILGIVRFQIVLNGVDSTIQYDFEQIPGHIAKSFSKAPLRPNKAGGNYQNVVGQIHYSTPDF